MRMLREVSSPLRNALARRARPTAYALAAAVACGVIAAPASADPVEACLDAHSTSQSLRMESKLLEARKRLLVCAAEVCPEMVRKDCAPWLDEVNGAIPSVVFVARKSGRDLAEVNVYLDGTLLVSKLDGRPVEIDPGPHKLRFELAGARVVEREVLIREGEKARTIEVKFESDAPVAPSSSVSASPAEPPGPARRPVPVSVWALGGTGALALGAFGYFALSGRSQESDLRDRGCEPYCPKSETDEVKQKYLLGDIFLAVGLVSLGTASYLYLKRPAAKEEKASVVRWNAGALRGGGFASIEGAF